MLQKLIFNRIADNTSQFIFAVKKLNNILHSLFSAKVCYKNHIYRTSHIITQNKAWKVLFFGTDEFAVESLKILHSKFEAKVLQRLDIVTCLKNTENAVLKYAKQNKIVVNKWPLEVDISDFHIGIVVSFGHLIPSNIINAFPLGMLNVHGSLLPKWRGAAPIIYTLMNGESTTGVTLMKIMPKKFDTGEIVLQKQIEIDEHETMPKLYTKLAKLGAELVEEVFENLPQLLQAAKPQSKLNVTYAPKVTKKISLINWNEMCAKDVYNLYRALVGLYPLTTSFKNRKVKLLNIQQIEAESVAVKLQTEVPGAVIYNRHTNALIIRCKDETFVSVKTLSMQGKRSTMSALEFNNGFLSGRKKTKIFFY